MQILEVPGNILLLGEYAILEEGGLGFVMAIDRKISFLLEASDTFEIKGQWGNRAIKWTADDSEPEPLIEAVFREFQNLNQNLNPPDDLPPFKITINTDDFRSMSGQKYGFGASAAVACGLAYLLFELYGLKKKTETQFNTALQGHRKAQNNMGSGYDIATSFYGGMGLFRGGKYPVYQPLELDWLPPGYLFPGPEAVPTVSAVSKYKTFKSEYPEETNQFRTLSNHLVEQFIQAGSWEVGMEILKQYQEQSILFQQKMLIDATLTSYPGIQPNKGNWIVKALGAGNELGLLLGNVEIIDTTSVIPVSICRDGPMWRQITN